MKPIEKIVLGLILVFNLFSNNFFSQSACTSTVPAPCSYPSIIPFTNGNDKMVYDAIRSIASGTTTTTGSVVVTNTVTVTGTVSTISTSTMLTASATSVTTSGTVAAGAKYILLETSSDFVGTIEGLRFLNNGFLPYPYLANGTWPAIAYTVSAGTLYIRRYN